MIQSDDLNIYLASSERGALRVELSLNEAYDCEAYFEGLLPNIDLTKSEAMNRPLIEAVEAALSNRPLPGNLPLDIVCTPFQQAVWQAIREIPFGQTRTYGEVARSVGKPGGARAVGQAMHRNPLPLIFP
jgi:O6-methylguanine-DNA--protein-cysteine methyltransferase